MLAGLSGTLPTSGPPIGPNLDCELSPATGWTVVSGVGTLSNSPIAHGGASSCVISGRTDPSHGIARTLTGLITKGPTLSVAFWVRVDAHTAASVTPIVKATLRLDGAGVPQFTHLSTIVANETDWRLISANVGLTWATTPTFARVFLEGPPAGTDILVDDASVRLFVP